MSYKLEGQMIEVCSCKAVCPCWVGEDPDDGKCEGAMAWHIDRGSVDGVDVADLTLGMVTHIPGNAMQGNWQAVVYVDDRATPEQEQALLSAFSGKQGGPLADMAGLLGEVVAVKRMPIGFEFIEGTGNLRIGEEVEAQTQNLRSPAGQPTTLHDAAFSFVRGAPYFVAKAPTFRLRSQELGKDLALSGHSSVQGPFQFEA